jgi:hypothetical protein
MSGSLTDVQVRIRDQPTRRACRDNPSLELEAALDPRFTLDTLARKLRSRLSSRTEKAMSTMMWVVLIAVLFVMFGGGGGYYWSRSRR